MDSTDRFDVDSYNKLLPIKDSLALFLKRAKEANLSPEVLLSKIASVFLPEPAGRYGICLLHNHYHLKAGERVVAHGSVSLPSTVQSDNIVADRWMPNGNQFEHILTNDPTSIIRPSRQLFAAFEKLTKSYNIDNLGICRGIDTSKLDPQKIFLESPSHRDRELITSLVHKRDVDPNTTGPSEWHLKKDAKGILNTLSCNHGCSHTIDGMPTTDPWPAVRWFDMEIRID